MSLEDPDFVDTWQRCFAASGRTKKLKDDKEKGGENEITDLFLATAGCEAGDNEGLHRGVITNLEDQIFEKNKSDNKKNMKPKKRLVVAEIMKFMSMK